jgi:hypothetical protein
MESRRGLGVFVVGLVCAAAVAACSSTVEGSGHAVAVSSQATDFPTSASAPAPAPSASSATATASPVPPTGAPSGEFSCPTITYPHAHLTFDCITGGLTLSTSNAIWPVSLHKTVEPSTNWVLEEGAGNWGDPGSRSATSIARGIRSQMIADGGYGSSPTLRVLQDADTTVAGVPAHVLQTAITLNPAWARGHGTKVTSERLWIVVMKVSDSDDTVWYTSIPNLASSLWPRVATIMKSIRVD